MCVRIITCIKTYTSFYYNTFFFCFFENDPICVNVYYYSHVQIKVNNLKISFLQII